MAREYNYDIGCVPSTFWFGFVGSNILVPIIALASGIRVKPDRRFLEAEGPIIVIANHESFLDPMVTSRLTHGRKVNFVCGEFLFRKHFWGHVFKLGGAIPKKQFAVDTSAVKAMMKVMKRKGVLIIYPEATRHIDGHTTDRFDDGVAKLAKKAGASIWVQHIHGAYMTMPRWCPDIKPRRGKITSEFVSVITSGEVSDMSVAELDRRIKDAIRYDENSWIRSSGIRFKGRSLAKGLQNIAYRCPCCDTEFSIEWCGKDKGDSLICSKCGQEFTYHDDGSITYGDEVTDLHQWTVRQKDRLASDPSGLELSCVSSLYKEQDQFNIVKVSEGILTVRDGVFRYVDSNGEESVFDMDRMRGIVCNYGRYFEI